MIDWEFLFWRLLMGRARIRFSETLSMTMPEIMLALQDDVDGENKQGPKKGVSLMGGGKQTAEEYVKRIRAMSPRERLEWARRK